ncbi:MAG: ABC transporter permease [Candidatus Promineifilaceae bacterium]
MASFFFFFLKRLALIPLTLIIVTAVLYSFIYSIPAEERASLYFPPVVPRTISQTQIDNFIKGIIEEKGLNDPFPKQYLTWVSGIIRGDWGWSPTFNAPVLDLLLLRTGATLELTFYALLTLIPLGLISGVVSGWRPGGSVDNTFRLTAFFATSIPPFIFGLFLLSIFYVGLGWFSPGRTGFYELSMSTSTFKHFTGFLTVDGLLNGRLDITLDAFRHLVLPVFTLSLAHWATLGRVTRVSIMNETGKEYLLAAKARGLRRRSIIWRHAFRNVLAPALTTSYLSITTLITGVFVIEIIFNYKGVSELITKGISGSTYIGSINIPDTPLALGFAIYSCLLVVPIMLLLDVAKAAVDPRIREELK